MFLLCCMCGKSYRDLRVPLIIFLRIMNIQGILNKILKHHPICDQKTKDDCTGFVWWYTKG